MKTFKQFMAESSDTIKKITKEPDDDLWFRHESPYWLHILKPLTYENLAKTRPDYDIDARKRHEETYRKLTKQPNDISFLYATVVGFNKMDTPESFPGFTYYFKMNFDQISKCVFGLVDKQEWMKDELGSSGLTKAEAIWNCNRNDFKSYTEKGLGKISPRIEVVIPFSIRPTMYFPQKEDR